MASLALFFILVTPSFASLSSCVQKEFTETPKEVQNSCFLENIENQWRGELSYTRSETYIEVQWRKIVQDWTCVKAMEFFVDGVKQINIWGGQQESVRIGKIGEFSLKVQVYFLVLGTPGFCYGELWECRCFEATKYLNVHEGNGGTVVDKNQEGTSEENRGTTDIPLVAGAFAGGNIFQGV